MSDKSAKKSFCLQSTWKIFGRQVSNLNADSQARVIYYTIDFTEIKQQLESINNNKVTELQLREFKKFAQLIRSDSDKVQNERIADKLVIIYFKERVKHPAKSTIQR